MIYHTFNPTLESQRQNDLCESQPSLVYIMILGLPGLCSETLYQVNQKQK